MREYKLSRQPDVIMIYQDKDNVESALQQILELELKFTAYKYEPEKMHDIAVMKPKVLLLSSNSAKTSIEFYINYLEENKQNIAPHSAILLINNRESDRAYLACENGLFDNYVIINPLNEPYRLKLVLLKELKLIENHKNNSLEQLISDGEEELASCIEHGVALKKSFLQEVSKYEKNISSEANKILDNQDKKLVLQNLICFSLEEMNENVSGNIQNIIDQLTELKINKGAIKKEVFKMKASKNKMAIGVNTDLLISDAEKIESTKPSCYRVLIAESLNLFTRDIEEIFSETAFKYLLVNDGQTALSKIDTFKPDVVLLAYDLPTLNGIEITKIIREKGNKVPIIAYTHHREKAVIKRWVPFGLSGYLIKPSKKNIILQNITKAIKNPIEIILHNKASDKAEIQWIPEYSVGNKEIDEQHKVLFTIINDFFQQDSKQEAITLFKNLSSYIDLHFASEENLLKQINYPETEEHIKIHRVLRAKFYLLEKKLDDYDIDVHHKIAMFLYNWLAKHILKSDMEYKSYALSIEEKSFIE
jgi:hemerythrin-like metal-binding protein